MSWVTTLMLHISPTEDADALIPSVNAFFASYQNAIDGTPQSDDGLAPISQMVPGGKCFGANVFVGAYNYFPLDAFIEHLRTLRWEEPALSQLIIMDEEDLSFRVLHIGNCE